MRDSQGISVGHRWEISRGAVAVGVDAGALRENRQRYENYAGSQLGVRGRLRRDERNDLTSHDLWSTVERVGDRWSLLGGLRHSVLNFVSSDHFLRNGDDSGRVSFRHTSMSAGVARSVGDGEVFASAGKGFDAPTASELAYRADGVGGLNLALRAAEFLTGEAGARWRGRGWQSSVAVFRIDTKREIVQVLSSGGRSSYANAGRSRRVGMEGGFSGVLGPSWDYRVTLNAMDASFVDGYATTVVRNGVPTVRVVAAGNRVPGIPRVHGFAQLRWRPGELPWSVSLDVAGNSGVPVDDGNSDFAPGHVLFGGALQWRSPRESGWNGFVRITNLFDRRVVGSVIVNESNGRSFEPAAGRSVTVGIGWRR